MLKEEGLELVVAMENLLSNYPSSDVTEQCVCVLINMSNASEKTRNVLVGREVLLQCVCELLVSLHPIVPTSWSSVSRPIELYSTYLVK